MNDPCKGRASSGFPGRFAALAGGEDVLAARPRVEPNLDGHGGGLRSATRPAHEDGWKREILRTAVDEEYSYVAS